MTRKSPSERSSPPGTEDPAFYAALGRAIKVLRTEQGMSRKELAARSGVSYPYVADIESGRGRPSSSSLIAIATALDMSPSTLLARAESFVGRMASEEAGPSMPSTPAAAPWFHSPSVPPPDAMVIADQMQTSAREEMHRLVDALPDRDLPLVLDLARRLLGGG